VLLLIGLFGKQFYLIFVLLQVPLRSLFAFVLIACLFVLGDYHQIEVVFGRRPVQLIVLVFVFLLVQIIHLLVILIMRKINKLILL